MNDQLATWQTRLAAHFTELHRRRCSGKPDQPIFALEHDLDLSEFQALASAVRAHVAGKPPSKEHALPWIVYAAEIGYGYSGDEYWQTFAKKTPGWTVYGDRDWIRDCYRSFHRTFGGAKPSGVWADQFSIICWPITHAILPWDLQRQLAHILYELRHSFSAELFESPSNLGELIAARSWKATSRFQNFAQETQLVGQIAAALLLQGQCGTGSLIHPSTLQRIGADLDRERRARQWLRGARRLAKERATIRGLSVGRDATRGTFASLDAARAEVAALGIEPRLVLQPTDTDRDSWQVTLEIPDLTHLLFRFPRTREILTDSRCRVAGAPGSPRARGFFLHGSKPITLARWPRQDEVLLQFEQTDPQLEYLLRAECLLRPGPTWLFRIASDGLAYELRSLRVRPGQRYIIVTAGQPATSVAHARPIKLACDGVHAALIDLPSSLTTDWEESLRCLGLGQAKTIEVWPAGLCAVVWDGEGHGEWLASERPCLAIRTDHPVAALVVSLGTGTDSSLEFTSVTPGDPIFIELPQLAVGLHTVRVCTRSSVVGEAESLGDLDVVMRIRETRPWSPGLSPQCPLLVRLNPPSPTLEQLWEGRVDLTLRGPVGRSVKCRVSFVNAETGAITVTKQLPPIALPVTAAGWRGHFERQFRSTREASLAYDTAWACELEFTAEELGAFTIRCEREFSPLRWTVRRTGQGFVARLVDDSGDPNPPVVSRLEFEAPCVEQPLEQMPEYRIPTDGALYTARRSEFTAAIVIPPFEPGLSELRCAPRFVEQTRSTHSVISALATAHLWGNARLPGDLVSAIRQRDVVSALARYIFFLLGGENWAKAEDVVTDGPAGIAELRRAVSRHSGEAEVGTAIARRYVALSTVPPEERVQFVAELAAKYLAIGRKPTNVGDPEWLSELALRIASDPTRVEAWAGEAFHDGVKRLVEDLPTLARAARFLVVAIDRHLNSHAATGELYAGWGWS